MLLLDVASLTFGQDQSEYAPYNLKKLRSVLDESKLPASKSSPTLIQKGEFAGAANEYFFLDPTGQYMTFTVEGDKNRSELRQETGDWDTASKKPQRMVAHVKVYVPEDKRLEQYTFLQIHDKQECFTAGTSLRNISPMAIRYVAIIKRAIFRASSVRVYSAPSILMLR